MFKKLHKNKYNSGMTLVELLVVIFIFMIITSIMIFSYSKFNSSSSIQNLADDIALSIRKAQGYAIGVRGANDLFNNGYGIHFTANSSISDLSAGSNKAFVLFADITKANEIPNEKYNYTSGICGKPSSDNECMEVLSITSADQIDSIFLNGENNPRPKASTLDILFYRPDPDPKFCYRSVPTSDGCDGNSSSISSVKIKISNLSNSEVFKIITITNNGQISVSNI